jgi:septation ring formation regulator EzrA
MTDETANMVLEMMKRIRASQERTELEIVDIKGRLTAMDESMALMRTDLAHLHTMYAPQSKRIDRIEDRLSRIERRLELVEVH